MAHDPGRGSRYIDCWPTRSRDCLRQRSGRLTGTCARSCATAPGRSATAAACGSCSARPRRLPVVFARRYHAARLPGAAGRRAAGADVAVARARRAGARPATSPRFAPRSRLCPSRASHRRASPRGPLRRLTCPPPNRRRRVRTPAVREPPTPERRQVTRAEAALPAASAPPPAEAVRGNAPPPPAPAAVAPSAEPAVTPVHLEIPGDAPASVGPPPRHGRIPSRHIPALPAPSRLRGPPASSRLSSRAAARPIRPRAHAAPRRPMRRTCPPYASPPFPGPRSRHGDRAGASFQAHRAVPRRSWHRSRRPTHRGRRRRSPSAPSWNRSRRRRACRGASPRCRRPRRGLQTSGRPSRRAGTHYRRVATHAATASRGGARARPGAPRRSRLDAALARSRRVLGPLARPPATTLDEVGR